MIVTKLTILFLRKDSDSFTEVLLLNIATNPLWITVPLSGILWFGGLDAWQHYCLRVLLWGTGCTPWRYVAFLDAAVERVLLRQVGGGYIFVHRLLLEYFAGQPDSEGTEARK